MDNRCKSTIRTSTSNVLKLSKGQDAFCPQNPTPPSFILTCERFRGTVDFIEDIDGKRQHDVLHTPQRMPD